MSDTSALSREDLAALTATYRNETRKFDRWGVALFIGGLSVGLLLMLAGDRFGWSDGWDPVFLALGWGLALGGMSIHWWRRQRAMEGLKVECASCSMPLLHGKGQALFSRAELIVATGNCPACGHEFIAREA